MTINVPYCPYSHPLVKPRIMVAFGRINPAGWLQNEGSCSISECHVTHTHKDMLSCAYVLRITPSHPPFWAAKIAQACSPMIGARESHTVPRGV
jgi:hypothetical protein